MKIAVILIGRIEEQYKSLNLQLLDGCDVYIHTDENFLNNCEAYKPVQVITTTPDYLKKTEQYFLSKYHNELNSIKKNLNSNEYFAHNFSRIVQWKRLDDILCKVDFSKYDYILKWRLDIFKFELIAMSNTPHNFNLTKLINSILVKNKNIYSYIDENTFDKNFLYSFLDFCFLGSYKTIKKVNLYPKVEKYLGKKEQDFEYNKETYQLSDFNGKYKCAKVEWLVKENKPFNHFFTSETAMIINCMQQNLIMKNFFRPLL